SYVMFEPDQIPSAFQYLQDELGKMGFEEGKDFTVHTYDFPYEDRHRERNWKNLILSFPGNDPELSQERVLMVAHLDSTSGQELTLAPGADDNGSGSAGLLEAAYLLRHHQFKRTINLIWFSGEEQSRRGSEYFVSDYQDWLPEIVGVINLDMFAFDWDGDRCFEVHAGTLRGSQQIARCLLQVIEAYGLDLTFDFIDDESAYTLSDHYPFWTADVPAVMVFENGFYQEGETCGIADRNYSYHTTADTLIYINEETGFSILQASLAALAHMAEPLGACFSESIKSDSRIQWGLMILRWEALPDAKKYQIWQKTGTQWQFVGETTAQQWVISLVTHNSQITYRVVAVGDTFCQPHLDIFPQK
ncbi:MAG: M28 family metallopeptidase, partial [Brevefilum sp.]